MDDLVAKFSIPREVRKRIKRSNAKGFLLCARKCHDSGKTYKMDHRGGEMNISVYDDNGKLEYGRYFMDTEEKEMMKLAKKYHTFKLENISTEALRALAKVTKTKGN